MAGLRRRRTRCVACNELFEPDPRNRTKVTSRQKVCKDCGPVVGHRRAVKRYVVSLERDPPPKRAAVSSKPEGASRSPPRSATAAPPETPRSSRPEVAVLERRIQANPRDVAELLLSIGGLMAAALNSAPNRYFTPNKPDRFS